MKKALYYNGNGQVPSELFVLSENANGTVELGRKEGEVLVSGCALLDTPKDGSAVLVEADEKPVKSKTK